MFTFVRLTVGVAVALLAFVVLLFVLKVVVIAAVVAGIVLAAMLAINFVRALARGTRPRLSGGEATRFR